MKYINARELKNLVVGPPVNKEFRLCCWRDSKYHIGILRAWGTVHQNIYMNLRDFLWVVENIVDFTSRHRNKRSLRKTKNRVIDNKTEGYLQIQAISSAGRISIAILQQDADGDMNRVYFPVKIGINAAQMLGKLLV